jgi:endonuclease G
MSWRILQTDAATSRRTVAQWALAAAGVGCFLHHDEPMSNAGHRIITTRAQAASTNGSRSVKAPVVFPTSSTTKLSPTLPIRIIRPNPDLEIAFDVRTRNAIYVMEKVDRQGQNLGKGHKRPNFYEERSIDQEQYRSRLMHYRNSGYDRGHLAPAADFPLQTEDTYNLCNVSPQNHSMNLSIWSQIEDFVRRVADRAGSANNKQASSTYVVTGPLWLPTKQLSATKFEYSYHGLGQPPSLVAVPTHFFKVVVVVVSKTSSIVEFACFVVPNTEPNKSKGMQDYIVPWTDLEAVTGLQLFPTLATEEWKEWADYVTHETVLRFTAAAQSQKGGGPLLLLTEGNNKKRKKDVKSSGVSADTLQHLCKGGECR